MNDKPQRRYPIGAELIAADVIDFRVWAPKSKSVEVALGDQFLSLASESNGYFRGTATGKAGTKYRFRLDKGESYPDPASRWQPEGPHGPSCVVDPTSYRWRDTAWKGCKLAGQIFYEFHVGTFTPEGSWRAAMTKLPHLRQTGVTVLEMMPIADFPGKFGWGYDGVNLFAPAHQYGTPDDLRAFIDAAHAHELAVVLDVVYNHFGPDGNYLGAFSPDYTHRSRKNEWGDTINFDGDNSGPVREFFLTNGRYWIEEFHFDGFRFDATQGIHDQSEEHIVGTIGRVAREAAGAREIILVAENEPQEPKLVRTRAGGGDDLDGLWNDDWHHSAIVALTARNEAYYTDYKGSPQEFISAAKYGYLFQGQPYLWQEAPRGYSSLEITPEAFVCFLENHDQIANSAFGHRVHQITSPGKYRAMTALLLLGPWTPLLFQGEEFGATTPFVYFADVGDEKLKDAVKRGRFEFLLQFPTAMEAQASLDVPHHDATFAKSRLDWSELERNAPAVALHRDLIALRRTDSRLRRETKGGVDGAVLGASSFLLRFFDSGGDERLLMVNLGSRGPILPAPEPLLAPPEDHTWEVMWSSELPEYGGPGPVEMPADEPWMIPAESATLFRPRRRSSQRKIPKKR